MNIAMMLMLVQNDNMYDGRNIAISGITTVFLGLILIAFAIGLFNWFFLRHSMKKSREESGAVAAADKSVVRKSIIVQDDVDDDVLVAIGTAVELYKRLYLETLQSKITFKHGKEQSGWKAGYKYGHR